MTALPHQEIRTIYQVACHPGSAHGLQAFIDMQSWEAAFQVRLTAHSKRTDDKEALPKIGSSFTVNPY